MAWYEGKCPECKRLHCSSRKGDIVVCDCYKQCPICGAEMTPYSPDLAMNTYDSDLAVLMVCTLHSPLFFSTKKPVEVVCT